MIGNDKQQSSLEASLLYDVPDALIWVRPILNTNGSVEDFEVGYANKAANIAVGHPDGDLTGLRVLRDGIPSAISAPANFQNFSEVYHSKEEREYTFISHNINRVFETFRQPHKDGILSITRDKGAQRKAEQAELASRQTMESIVKNSPMGIALFEAIRNDNGTIVDFRPLVANKVRNEMLGLTEEEGDTFLFSKILEILKVDLLDKYIDIAEKNTAIEREQYVEKSQKWLAISAVKLNDGFLALLSDITEIKKSQHILQHQSDYLTNILNASLSAVCTCEAVTDESGNIYDLRFTQVNDMYQNMIGRSGSQVIGKTMRELFPTAVNAGLLDTYINVVRTGESKRFDMRYQGEGLDAWFDIASVKLGDNAVVITFADVLEQKTASEKIQEQKRLLDNILTGSSNGIAVSEFIRNEQHQVIDCRTLLANDAAIQISGIPKEVYLHKTMMEVEPGMFESPYFQMCVQTLETGIPFITQYFLELSQRWLEVSVSKMDDDHLIHIFTDVTPVKEAQIQKDQLVAELKRSNDSLQGFAHAASHDMKEPLRKITLFSGQLKTMLPDGTGERAVGLIDRISTAAERLQTLVDDLLEFSYVSERPQELEEVDLNEKVTRVLTDLELPIEEKNARFEIGNLPTIKGNRRQIQQLFYNLIGNALKYSKAGVSPEIEISAREVSGREVHEMIDMPENRMTEHYHLIQIRDNGIGFDQEYAEQIFKMFQRLHGKTEYSGTGIGLSIARKVIENHHGFLWATSQKDVGSTFYILLPV